MNPRTASIVLVFLAVLGWVLTVVVLAEPKALFSVHSGWGCGVFECSSGLDSETNCGDYNSALDAVRAFGVIAAILMGVMMIIHALQLAGKGSILPGAIVPYLRYVHIVSAVCMTIVWVLMVCLYDAEWCGGKWSNLRSASPGHGIFLAVVAMITEIICFFLCSKAGGTQNSGAMPF